MKKRLLVVHGGAPTAVINATLYGVINEAEGRYGEDLRSQRRFGNPEGSIRRPSFPAEGSD